MEIEELAGAYDYPEDSPWLRANMIATLDGAIQYKGNTGAIGYETDWLLMQELRKRADVVIMGASTVREYDEFPSATPLVVVSRSLDLDFDGKVFAGARSRPIVVTCAAAPAERLRAAGERAEVLVCGDRSADVGLMLETLAQRGLRRMLCEGGPTLLAEVAAAGWLHELCLTMSPMVVAGTAKRILDGPVIDIQRMKLRHTVQDGDYLFLRYQVER
ncbi:pyrimidine reductase family protein [Actinomadura kijaniata]|uniref:Riboflavin biosynthesis pyrimidine reductase n=1 Tax=Actinomadura namibiensis TaxID=182080 RepID=A0A7W3LWN5_ACTNM|nr:dihydrofolate reductase family protein [Actinomadura namibiensis]MBA8955696.1 riboflavin biosynthesis pyrimidine reductase [Actinomadura namibiensis]